MPRLSNFIYRFAYVDFASPDHKIIAITLSEREFHGRRLLIKDGTFSWRSLSNTFTYDRILGDDFTGRPAAVKEENLDCADHKDKTIAGKPAASGSTGLSKTAQKILRIQKQPAAPTLFLGNLGFEATEKSIRELFEAHRGSKVKVEDGEERGLAEEKDGNDKDKWIRKIRMGTFEDTGNCKGYVSFITIFAFYLSHINIDGRLLILQV